VNRKIPRFVVPAKEEDVIGVSQFEAEEQHDGLKRIIPPIDEVSNEDVSRLRGLTG
jgi:hemerythrin superfamily protein